MTPYQKHKKKWSSCTDCVFHERRKKVCLVRGNIPADVLFIGEAPGDSEDTLAKPFCGPAGKLLDEIIEMAWEGTKHTYAMTNLLGCIPKGEDGQKIKQGKDIPQKCIDACEPRLVEIIQLVKPQVIILVGTMAMKNVVQEPSRYKYHDIYHPAYLIRLPVDQKGLAIRRTVVALADALDDVVHL